jgi:hypothetical protein
MSSDWITPAPNPEVGAGAPFAWNCSSDCNAWPLSKEIGLKYFINKFIVSTCYPLQATVGEKYTPLHKSLQALKSYSIYCQDRYQRAMSLPNSHVSNRHSYTVPATCNSAAGYIASVWLCNIFVNIPNEFWAIHPNT